MNQALAIPEQTATGKEIPNPLMVGSLPKTTKQTLLDFLLAGKVADQECITHMLAGKRKASSKILCQFRLTQTIQVSQVIVINKDKIKDDADDDKPLKA